MARRELTIREAAAEKLRRQIRKTRQDSFLEFCRHVSPDGEPAFHHKVLIQKLQDVGDGKIQRLAIFMPPGHGKSVYSSILFPIWYLGRQPGKRLVAASHTSDLSDYFGRRARSLVQSDEYFDVFRHGLNDKNKAAGEWMTEKGSEYFAIGVMGAVTGRRADGGLIDDPVKGREEADSELVSRKIWEWYRSDFYTRLKPQGWVILIMTRWTDHDLAGRLFGETFDGKSGEVTAFDGEIWDVLSLPAIAEAGDPIGRKSGDALWPEWFTKDKLEKIKITQGARNWSALYQQRPSPEEGNFFKREWVQYYDEKPQNMRIYGASDYAVTSKGGDYTVHMVIGVDPNDDIYILDLWRGQTESIDWVERFISLVQRYKPLEWAEETGQILKSLDPIITKRMMERKVYCYRKQYSSTKDKQTRAQAFRSRMAQGKVFFPRKASWTSELEHEILTFPAGKHDDTVDCCSLVGRMLDRMVKGSVKAKPKPGKILQEMTYDDLWKSQKPRRSAIRL